MIDIYDPTTLFLLVVALLLIAFSISMLSSRNKALAKQISTEFKLKDEANKHKQTIKQLEQVNSQLSEFQAIVDIDAYLKAKTADANKQGELIEKLKLQYKQGREIYDSLEKQIALYRDDVDMIEEGFYEAMFEFDTSDEYKNKLDSIKEQQKSYVRSKKHIYSTTEWTLNGSKVEGRKNTNRLIKLTARAYNNECDAAYGKVKWNNINKLIERLNKVQSQINKDNDIQKIEINPDYHNLKIQELRVRYELMEKRNQEKVQQAELRQQNQEEVRLKKETEEADKKEKQFQSLLEKAKQQAEKASGDKLNSLLGKMKQLEADLEEAHAKNERAKSMAEQTKAGYIYVISNIGSFGENVYKIGMTRRLVPMDRVKELGDASVPFVFDTHAMIYTDNAPELEKQLHRVFDQNRVNMVNNRKEFFAVDLDDIEREVKQIKPEAEFVKTIEAREYRETQLKRALIQKQELTKETPFPDELEFN